MSSTEDVPDPVTGLTPREKKVVKDTWKTAQIDRNETGYVLFIKFFTENPSYQANFKSFNKVPLAELRGNKRVLAHALNVLYAIESLVDNLDEPETLTELLLKLSGNHFRRGILFTMFDNLGSAFVGTLVHQLGNDVMNEFAVNAWKKTYAIILGVIAKGLEAAAKAED